MFRERIQAKYEELTPSFRKLADFVLEHQLDAAFMTATELARHLDLDAATVVRFAQSLEYSGFRELIKEVQKVVKAELTATYSPSLEAPDDTTLFQNLLENERQNLALAQARLTDQANTVLPSLIAAEHIWVTGQGHCTHLAGLFASMLREHGLAAIAIAPDPATTAAALKQVGDRDLVIGFSLTGMELDVAGTLRFAGERGANTLVLSASDVTAASLVADTRIICPGPTMTHLPSFAGLAAMMVAIGAGLVARYPDRAASMTEDLKQSYEELLELQAHFASETDVEELWRQF
jgi:DNA-binding MurR/RpiR family transcriptional regulator